MYLHDEARVILESNSTGADPINDRIIEGLICQFTCSLCVCSLPAERSKLADEMEKSSKFDSHNFMRMMAF